MTVANESPSNRDWLHRLEPTIAKIRVFSRLRATHLGCARIATVKIYELLQTSHVGAKSSMAFLVPSLRASCEELIILRFMRGMPSRDRNSLISALLHVDLVTAIEKQNAFLARWQPWQPALRTPTPGLDRADEAREVWNRHGWPKLKKGTSPQVRQIAERGGDVILRDLYDFLYAMTSSAVHFSPRNLLRYAWGDGKKFIVSTANLSPYYLAVVQVYGSWLLCAFLETFAGDFRVDVNGRAALAGLRQWMLSLPRWPEYVTPEELNVAPPRTSFVVEAVVQELRRRAAAQKRRLLR